MIVGGCEIRLLGPGDGGTFDRIAPDVFDNPVDPALLREFLGDPRHHLVVALDGADVIGFVSGVHYVHPDKPAQMFVNEVTTAGPFRRRGIARAMIALLCERAQALGCSEAWVLTDEDNVAAQRLYAGAGGERTEAVMFTVPLDGHPGG